MGGKKDRVAQKAEAAASKKAVADQERERQEEQEWEKGAKKANKKKQDDEEKRAKKLEEKNKREAELQNEIDSLPSKPKTGGAKAGKKTAAPARKAPTIDDALKDDDNDESLSTLNAGNIDDALDALDIASKSSKSMAHSVDAHPERRKQAAYKAYYERELPKLKIERPNLRLQQYKDLIFKAFQKSPENPMNQANAAYNATADEKRDLVDQKRKATENRLR